MFKRKKKPAYVLSANERAKIIEVKKRLEVASEEVIAARAVFIAALQAIAQARVAGIPGGELLFEFDDFAFYHQPPSAVPVAPPAAGGAPRIVEQVGP